MKKAKKATEQVTVEMRHDEATRAKNGYTTWRARLRGLTIRITHYHSEDDRLLYTNGAWFEVERPGFPAITVRSRDFAAALKRVRLLAVL